MLNQKIRETIAMFREVLPPEQAVLIEQGAGEISALAIVENALKIGDQVPDFALSTHGGDSKTLGDYLNAGPLVLTFYRGSWCPYCNLQLKEYNDNLSAIKEHGGTLVAITPEKPGAADLLAASGAPDEVVQMVVSDVGFDILHDAQNQLARKFGLVFELPESHRRLLNEISVNIEMLTGDNTFVFPDPATYVIAPDGEIRWAFVPNNYRKRAEVQDILDAIQTITSVTHPGIQS